MDRCSGGGASVVLLHRADGTAGTGGLDDVEVDAAPLPCSSVVLRPDGSVLLEARLQGGAPWGFTLKGGLEHGEPLIISKVEEGGKADSLEHPLQAGDQMLIINEVELAGFRQEAISLVKGSYKTLTLTIRRECCAGSYFEVSGDLPASFCAPPPPPHPHRGGSRCSSSGGVRLRIKNRHSEPASRPHSWHSTKLGESQEDPGMVQLSQGGISTMGTPWHHTYNTSASTTDLAEAGFDSGGCSYLRKSPDQYSSRGSMDSLDPPPPSSHHLLHHHHHLPPGAPSHPQHHHHAHAGPHPAYSSCHQLSYARSSNSIDHLHSKRDSAYSSFSTSSSIPEYLAAGPASFSPERSYSLETVPQRGGGGGGEIQQADMRYVRTVYDPQQGLISQEHELSSASAAFLGNSESRAGVRGGGGVKSGLVRELQVPGAGVCYRSRDSSSSSSSSSSSGGGGGGGATDRHSAGPIWGPAARRSSYESLKGVPAPPQRSDSYAAIKNHERPNSWSSLEHARSLRSLHKGSWHHSSGSVSSAKGSYAADGQLHTVIEKSPESSPTTKPRQGGSATPQPTLAPPGAPHAPGGSTQPGRLMLPTGVYPVPQPEPHYAQMPSSAPSHAYPGGGVYPALAKESIRQQQGGGRVEQGCWRDGRSAATENGYQSSSVSLTAAQLRVPETDRSHQEEVTHGPYRSHLQPTVAAGVPEGQVGPPRPHIHQGAPHIQSLQGTQQQTLPNLQGAPQYPTSHQGHSHQDVQVAGNQWNQQGHRSLAAPQAVGQERRDPFTTVQPRGDRSRTTGASGLHPGPVGTARVAQGQVAPSPPTQHSPQPPQTSGLQPAEPRAPPSSQRHRSDSSAAPQPQQQQHQQRDHGDPREREVERERVHGRGCESSSEREREREHPLTRLEMALAEVQRCSSPDSVLTTGSSGQSQSNSYGYSDSNQANSSSSGSSSNGHGSAARTLSVLEKVSRFERRSLKQRSQSIDQDRTGQDLRNILERSTSGAKAHRTMSYRGDRGHPTQHRNPDPGFALQRSRSTFQLGETEEGDSSQEFPRRGEPLAGEGGREFPWRQEIQELLGSIQDTSYNRTYRDSLKDAQTKVLSSTSFCRRELSSTSSTSPPPPNSDSSAFSFSDKQQPPTSPPLAHQPQPVPPVPAKYHSLDRKAGPKTMPKPQGMVVVIPAPGVPVSPPPGRHSPPPPPVTSPHTPKERHVVSPEVRGPSPPALPSVPPVGQVPQPTRAGGRRKRLTAEQKKRSYSEPESMHEVGVSDVTESSASSLFRRGGETSVADRRRMFELAASRGPSQIAAAASRPDLRQLQQDALAQYVERKRGRTREDGGGGAGAAGAQGRRCQRPRSAYQLQPTGSLSHEDTLSLSSTSSLLSLQDSVTPERSLCPGERRLCSTLPPGADLHSVQSNLIYPGRVTAPRASPSRQRSPTDDPGSHVEASDIHPPQDNSTTRQVEASTRGPSQQFNPLPERSGPGRGSNGAPERSGPGRGSGKKSASVEDLLERPEDSGKKSASLEDLLERREAPQHYRSRSSPTVETPHQGFCAGELRMFGVFTSRPGRLSPTDRPTGTRRPERPTSATSSSPPHHLINYISHTYSSPSPAQDPALSHPPAITRRERQRNADRQRVISASNLAASVGLPCPFSPPPGGGGANPGWHASERLSQANLDAIAFPCSPRMSAVEGDDGRRFSKEVCGAVSGEATSSAAGGGDSDSSAHGASAFRAGPAEENPETETTRLNARAEWTSGDAGNGVDARGEFRGERALGFDSGNEGRGEEGVAQAPSLQDPSWRRSVSPPSLLHRLSSLRISESNSDPAEPCGGQSRDSFDEVFFEPPPPPPPPPPIRETDITEDHAPPLPPPPPGHDTGQPIRDSCECVGDLEPSERRPSVHSPSSPPSSSSSPVVVLLPPASPQPLISPSSRLPSSSVTPPPPGPDPTQDDPESGGLLQYLPMPRRERSAGEQRVEALVSQLVQREPSLASILDPWAGLSTLDLMEELFPSSPLVGRSAWQRRDSSLLDDRIQDGGTFDGGVHSPVAERGLETDLDEEEKDLNAHKMELCEALQLHMASLREEKEALTEEQRSHQSLGSSLDSLVQEHCKANERDKYRSFIGDLEKIVNLLLSLCGRLARIDRALSALDTQEPSQDDTEQKDSLHQKRSQLISQTEDARELKENLERRQRAVHSILSGCLATAPHLRDYRRYVRAKPSLLIRQRHLDDLARQGEELLARLSESLPPPPEELSSSSGNCGGWSAPLIASIGPIDHQHHRPLPSSSLLPGLVPGHGHSARATTTVTSL